VDIESTSGYEQAIRYQNDTAAGDRALAVRFYTDEFPDAEATAREGRPMFRTEECVEIQVPGSRDIKMGRVKYMKPDPRQRFPEAYANFKKKAAAQYVGTPLAEWGWIPRSAAKSYAALGIHTVEHLAGLSDTHAREIMGSIADRQKARDFIAQAKGQEPLAQARAELEKAQAQIADLVETVKAQGEKIEALGARPVDAPVPKRRGRPPKAKPADPPTEA
jgi:hypothetical protein